MTRAKPKDVATFLAARLDERETAAREAAAAAENAPSGDLSQSWHAEVLHAGDGRAFAVVEGAPIQATRPTAFAATAPHIAANDPAQVLADIAAQRRVLDLHHDGNGGLYPGSGRFCAECTTPHDYAVPLPCPTLRALATAYAGHPDYRQEWKP